MNSYTRSIATVTTTLICVMVSFSQVFAFQIIESHPANVGGHYVTDAPSFMLPAEVYQTGASIHSEIPKKSESLLDTDDPFTGGYKTYRIKDHGHNPRFSWGNCTAFVAQNKSVTWRGNANQWIRNAKAQGVPTGKAPAVGAIIQLEGHGYNPYYGHVGIVVGIKDTKIIIKDMNYQKLNTVTIREIPKDHPAIKGYIYVD
ncbi:MAG: CHAP domain-containing protein [Candidatus Gracilibacteria bacterium]